MSQLILVASITWLAVVSPGPDFVTPAAVSHQIKSLEDFLGQPLFERTSRAVELTPAGSRCFPGVHAGFEAIRTALAQAGATEPEARLVITAGPAFVSKWLAPRLHAFVEEHPAVDTRIAADLSFSSFSEDGVDVAIRFGNPRKIENLDRGRLYVERLVEESVVRACGSTSSVLWRSESRRASRRSATGCGACCRTGSEAPPPAPRPDARLSGAPAP